jgi:hypothetical protein
MEKITDIVKIYTKETVNSVMKIYTILRNITKWTGIK